MEEPKKPPEKKLIERGFIFRSAENEVVSEAMGRGGDGLGVEECVSMADVYAPEDDVKRERENARGFVFRSAENEVVSEAMGRGGDGFGSRGLCVEGRCVCTGGRRKRRKGERNVTEDLSRWKKDDNERRQWWSRGGMVDWWNGGMDKRDDDHVLRRQ
jgi:hypothetical protein